MSNRSTRYVDQPEGPRDRSDCGTVLTPESLLPVAYEALFFANYRSIRTLARTVTPGVGLVAIEVRSSKLAGRAWVARKAERPNSLILGRHSECDLVLEQPAVSLRHVALLVPAMGRDERFSPHFSVHDLNSELGLHASSGEAMPGAHVEGFGMFRLGGYALFMFATGRSDAWPELASDAWESLSDRRRAPMPEEEWGHDPLKSIVASVRGPMHFSEPLLKDREEVTQVRVLANKKCQRVRLGGEALRRGVIFGRYPRCDTVLQHENISRVHLLVIEVDGEVVAVDTASTNGLSTDDDEEARVVMLGRGERAILADDVATLSLGEG